MLLQQGIILLVLVAGVAISRAAVRLVNESARNSDAFVHFVIARRIKENGFRVPNEPPRSYLPGRFSYPCLVHYLLAVLPEPTFETVDRYFSPLADLLYTGLIILLVPFKILTLQQAALATLIFLSTPQFVRPDQPHNLGFSSRKIGVILSTTALFAFTLWILRGEFPYLLVAVALGALLALTSRFSIQAFFGTSISFSVLVSPYAIGVFVGSVLLAGAISNGFYFRVLIDHIRFAYDYAVRKQYVFLYDGFKSIDTIRQFVRAKSLRGLFKAFHDAILLRSLFDNPYVIPVLVAYVLVLFGSMSVSIQPVYHIWFGTGLTLFVLTSFYHLRFLGHAGRYLEHSLFPGLIIIGKSFTGASDLYQLVVVGSIISGTIVIMGYFYLKNKKKPPTQGEAFQGVIDFLKQKPAGRVLVQPRHFGSQIAWETPHSVNDYTGNVFNSFEVRDEWDKLFPEEDPWVTDDLVWLDKQYSADWYVFDTTREHVGLTPPADVDSVYSNDKFDIYPRDILINNM